ncbi:7-cyano-7-deazaguanine synthase [Neolewinella aurantiaca]|uniref:7-cyano-7-deazaguanine synthase n=1 Tax=Neolewinella aurantiaca TaxID=2602767 RepID=A0A5C7FDI8_9BACT|nr:7-cyano-7-deazaguanine synthase [Neolewinella aurantiaca]TXF87540.1 7-cyano-7-deazaguanine synthase [Neolewinella aurantiaca]
MNNKLLLLSGGMDSIAVAHWKKPKYAVTIDYGQKPAKAEISAAKSVCATLKIEHFVINANCSDLGSGDLSDNPQISVGPVSEWWPYRNQLLLTLAAMKALHLDVKQLIIGSVSTDSIHVDGTLEFYREINELISMQEGNLIVETPAISMTTTELIKTSKVPYSTLLYAHSCHKSNHPCMHCRGCQKYLYNIQQLELD